MTSDPARPYDPIGFLMIEDLEVQNFRCFKHLKASGVKRFNIIVGDSAVGKTALLEAVFMALSGNVEVSIRLKTQRGFEPAYTGTQRAITEAIWRDYFYEMDWDKQINVSLRGTGNAARLMTICKGEPPDLLIPLSNMEQGNASEPSNFMTFKWIDASGIEHVTRPQVTAKGIQIPPTSEDLPDFFYFSASHPPLSNENAVRFSALSQEGREQPFIEAISSQYGWIEGLNIEVVGGMPMIHAKIRGRKRKLPINVVSGGVNRMLSIMLSIAHPRSVVLVDEIEQGIYYKQKHVFWKLLRDMARKSDSQVFMTTHDEEWLAAIADEDASLDDVGLWRLETSRSDDRVLRQFSGETFRNSVGIGGEIR
jgi:predicted ATPase